MGVAQELPPGIGEGDAGGAAVVRVGRAGDIALLLIQRYAAYQAGGLEVLAVFESPRASILEYVGKQDAPFPIIADPEARLYDLYGVEISEDKVAQTMSLAGTPDVIREAAEHGFVLTQELGSNFHRIPADFLIGPDLMIRRSHYAAYVTDHLPFEVIEQLIVQEVA
ncbi:MAG: redoxin domain-containing protein [Roseiflexaceae bacterium]